MKFVRELGIVGLAVGLAIGLQAADTVQKLVDGFINPLVSFVLSFILANPADLELLTWNVGNAEHPLVFGWGMIVSGVIKLLAVAFVIYFIVKQLRLDKKA